MGGMVALLTDYGTRDYYVGAVRGVMLSTWPEVRLADVTHEIEPHNVLHGAFVLRRVWQWFPAGTVFFAVVDPGVGTDRMLLAGRYADRLVVAPDNGLLTFVHRDFETQALHRVENTAYFLPEVSATFHGRDILAPVAVHLAKGLLPALLGAAIDQPVMLSVPDQAERTAGGFTGQVVYVDRFGTLVSNIHAAQLAAARHRGRTQTVVVDGVAIGPVREKFADVARGEPLALLGSAGLLEIAVNHGRAVDRFGASAVIGVEEN